MEKKKKKTQLAVTGFTSHLVSLQSDVLKHILFQCLGILLEVPWDLLLRETDLEAFIKATQYNMKVPSNKGHNVTKLSHKLKFTI